MPRQPPLGYNMVHIQEQAVDYWPISGKAGLYAGFDYRPISELDPLYYRCPFGPVGRKLWVKETFCTAGAPGDFDAIQYRADEDCITTTWKPSIFMPRWASRITLEVTGVRVERLQEINEKDAKAEGVTQCEGGYWNYIAGEPYNGMSARTSYSTLWESINGNGSWELNPWVWVIEFRKTT